MSSEPESNLATEERLNEAIAAYIRAIESGETPNRQEILHHSPELAAELKDFFAGQDQVGRLVAPLRSAVGAAFVTQVPDETPREHATRNGRAFEAPGRSFGDYELLEEIGRGGMGVVYRARQKSLNRLVALKMVRIQDLASAAEAQRFRNEAETVGALDHPHIVPVYEVGERDGYLYYTMRLVEGGSLDKRRPEYFDQPRAAAQLVATVARAVHHAHQRGVLHRDLKPGNILVDQQGGPHVADFGLAKWVAKDASLTQSGMLVGTPGYMAPEQTTGRKGKITTATDVYGLGSVLYSLLTGRPPFRGDNVWSVLEQVNSREPEPPSKLNQRVDRDLECIRLKCLQKEPELRYGSVELLAEDLEHWLAGEPVKARPIGRVSRVRRWCRRRPWVASLALISILLVNLLLIGSIGSALWVARERNRAQEAAQLLRRHLYAADVRQAYQDFEQGYLSQTCDRLARYDNPSDEEDLRTFPWFYLWNVCNQNPHPRILTGHEKEVYFVTFAPDGKTLASAGMDGTARIWDVESGKMKKCIHASEKELNCVAFSPDGKILATAGDEPIVKLWNLADTKKKPVELKEGLTKEVVTVVFSPNGETIATAGADREIRIWKLATLESRGMLPLSVERINFLAYSPDGSTLASISNVLTLWNMTTREGHVYDGWGGGQAVEFSHSGRSLAASNGRLIGFWDFPSGQARPVIAGDPLQIQSIQFSPDDRTLLSVGDDGTIRLWDLEHNERMSGFFRVREFGAWCIALSKDGNNLACSTGGGLVSLFSLRKKGITRLRSKNGTIGSLALSSDGTQAAGAVGVKSRTVELWDTTSGKILHSLEGQPGDVVSINFSPDGHKLLIGCANGIARVWNVASGKPIGEQFNLKIDLVRVAWSPGAQSGLINEWGRTHLWDFERVLPLRAFASEYSTFTPDGRSIVLALPSPNLERKVLSVLSLQTNEQRFLVDVPNTRTRASAFSPDGQLFAAVSDNGSLLVLELASGKQLINVFGHVHMIRAVAFSPDGLTLATAGVDKEIKLWDVRTWQELATLRGHEGEVFSLVFRLDGRTLISAGLSADSQAEVRFWSLDSNEGGG